MDNQSQPPPPTQADGAPPAKKPKTEPACPAQPVLQIATPTVSVPTPAPGTSLPLPAGVTPLANTTTFPGGINLTITNGAINIKPATSTVPLVGLQGGQTTVHPGSGTTCVVQTPAGTVSGGNVTIRPPHIQPTGAPPMKLANSPGTLNVRLAAPAVQGVLNTNFVSPMLGKAQSVTIQHTLEPRQFASPVMPVTVPITVAGSQFTVPLQQTQVKNITLQQLPTVALPITQNPAVVLAEPNKPTQEKQENKKELSTTDSAQQENNEKPKTSSQVEEGGATKELPTPASAEGKTDVDSASDQIADSSGSIPAKEGEANKDTFDFDPMQALKWENGVGTLPGSEMKFRMNEFGAMELIMEDGNTNDSGTTEALTPDVDVQVEEEEEQESCTSSSPDVVTPTEERPKSDEFVRCLNCGTYGMVADFFKAGPIDRFCSQMCHNTYKAANKSATIPKPSFPKKTIKELPASLKFIKTNTCNKKRLMVDDMKPRPATSGAGRGRPRTKNIDPMDADDAEVARALGSGKKTKGFSWSTYLEQEQASGPPLKLLKTPFPTNKNSFKVGMKMEGIDPRHPSLYCVLSVSEVRGYRIRLHFDGYSECYDFWLDANSPDIFPVGWCEKNNKKLQPPKGFPQESFTWSSYLKISKAQAAPRHLFQSQQAASLTPHGFRVGMKLEAIDKKNTVLICVATVSDIIGDRILIHFDGWEDSYDYWADPTSPYIKPVGYCQEMEKALSPPNDCDDISKFTWEDYLRQTKSQPVPARAFKQRAPHQFEISTKLEVVDKRNPILIRVASVVDVEDYRIKIHFDGWADVYDYWLDDDSPEYHPPGWCAKTGHPLQPPISPADLAVSPSQGGCPTPGCKGIGHIKGAKYTGHHSAFGCPYSVVNMNKPNILHDRLGGSKPDDVSPPPKIAPSETKSNPLAERKFPQGKYKEMVNGDHKVRVGPGRPARKKHKFLSQVKQEREDEDQENMLHNGIHESVFMSALLPNPVKDFPLCWEQHSKLLPGVGKIKGTEVVNWSMNDVATFVNTLPGCDDQGRVFQDEQIDGEAFLLLNQTDIVKIMNIKLGPALKIYNSILMFKSSAES